MNPVVAYTVGMLALLACTAGAATAADLWSRHVDRVRVDQAVDERMAVPLVEAREELTELANLATVSHELAGYRIGTRWPGRQTPMLHDQIVAGPAQWDPFANPVHTCEPPLGHVRWWERKAEQINEPARHGCDEVATGLLTYQGGHRLSSPPLPRIRPVEYREAVSV